jgi:glycerol-3-phosphate acyltransferase PlsY
VLILLPQAMPILLAVFLLTTAAGKMVSLGSILGAASLIPCLFLFHPPSPIMAFSCFAVAMIVWKHQGNIKRVLAGTENKLILRKK